MAGTEPTDNIIIQQYLNILQFHNLLHERGSDKSDQVVENGL